MKLINEDGYKMPAKKQAKKPVSRRRKKNRRTEKQILEDQESSVDINGIHVFPTVKAHKKSIHVKYLKFEEAKRYIANISFVTSRREYKDWIRLKKLTFLPLNPERTYKDDWESWPDYLNTFRTRVASRNLMNFMDALKISHKLAFKYNIKTRDEWLDFYDAQYLLPKKEQELPTHKIPRFPTDRYKQCKGFRHWLGRNLNNSVQQVQYEQRLIEEIKEDRLQEYNGQPVFAITRGIDPVNDNLIKVIAEPRGLISLILTIEKLHYDIISIFIYDQTRTRDLTQILLNNGIDHGNSSYLINNLDSLLHDLRQETIEVSEDNYK